MAITRPEMVLIDVDGTLVDSVPDLAYCVDRLMEALGRPVHGEAKVREWVGNGVPRLIERALSGELDGHPEAADYARAEPIFMECYAANTSTRSHLYDGVREGMDWLKAQGFKLGCVTNKAARFTEPLLKDLGIYDDFSIVVSGDTLAVKKPDPGPLLHVAKFFDVPPERSMMIGDSISDVKAARAAGFQITCLSYGYNHGIDIRESSPDAVIDSFSELPGLLG
jgi:phosphoglycolate phosphatase